MIPIMETSDKESIILNDALPVYAVHPGSILVEELKERGIKQKDFAKSIGMEAPHLSALIHGKRNVTAAIATRLETGLGIPASVWLNIQNRYNLSIRNASRVRPRSLVKGYSNYSGHNSLLNEPKSDNDGTITDICLKITVADYPLLLSLAKRMGWEIKLPHGNTIIAEE